MADTIPYTPARALQVAQLGPSILSPTSVRVSFSRLLRDMSALVRVEEDAAQFWTFYPAIVDDPDEITHAYAVVDATAQAVLDTAPALPGDKALQFAALMVRLAIDMEEAMDRSGMHQMIAHARACLLLEEDDPDAAATNHLLKAAFSRLDRLAALEEGEALLPCGEYDAELEPVFCA